MTERFATDDRIRVAPHAVSDRRGTVTFNITESSVFGSVLTPREAVYGKYAAGGTWIVERVEIPAARLDDLVDERVSLLKIDVQGNEAAVLRGTERVLKQTNASIDLVI